MPFEKKEITKFGEEKSSFEQTSINEIKLGYYSSQNLEGLNNEDSLLICSNLERILLGVADGAGGYPQGEIASRMILTGLSKESDQTLLEKIDSTSNSIREETSGAKTTLAIAEIKSETIRFFTVGDSEILMWNSNDNQIYKSVPHSPVGHKVEAGVISQDESLEDPERNMVTYLVGDKNFSIQSSSSLTFKKGYTCIIGTDGLFDNLSHTKLEEIITGQSYSKAFETLVNICEKRAESEWIKDDDIAFILIGW